MDRIVCKRLRNATHQLANRCSHSNGVFDSMFREQLAANNLSNLDDFSLSAPIGNDSFMGNRTPQTSMTQTPNSGSERLADLMSNGTPGSPSGCSTPGYFENYPLCVDPQESSVNDLESGWYIVYVF